MRFWIMLDKGPKYGKVTKKILFGYWILNNLLHKEPIQKHFDTLINEIGRVNIF